MNARCHRVNVTIHEKVMLTLYRAVAARYRRTVDGVLYLAWTISTKPDRFMVEGKALGGETLRLSHIAPFSAAARSLTPGEWSATKGGSR